MAQLVTLYHVVSYHIIPKVYQKCDRLNWPHCIMSYHSMVNDENRENRSLKATAGEIVTSPSATDKAFARCWPHRRSRCTRVHAMATSTFSLYQSARNKDRVYSNRTSAAPYHTVPPQLGCAGWLCRLLRCSVWRSVQRQEAFNDRSCCKSSAAKETPRVP